MNHYNLQMIIAVGFKVNNQRAVRFRVWANQIVEQYTIKGWAMDEERLKNGGTILTKDYFEEQLQRVREIRLSERRFYQKITDIYATSVDYDANSKTTKDFFAKVQNQLHWAIHGETAAETIYRPILHRHRNFFLGFHFRQIQIRVDNARHRRQFLFCQIVFGDNDVEFLDFAVRRVFPHHAGTISAEIAKRHAETEFEKYRVKQDQLYQSEFDRFLLESDGTIEISAPKNKTEGKK